ncbi:unnamed protein product, partial [Timema podura]|nr:unnamed protein product [Timema podura]
MAVCYSLMGRELWGNRSIGELTQRQLDAIKSKRKVIQMFILVVIIFALCWLPYHGFFIYAYHNNDVTRTSYVQHMYLTFYWFAMANAMVNPAIYYWMNVRFRLYFRQALCLCCCARKTDTEKYELPTTRQSQSEMARSKSGKYNNRAMTKCWLVTCLPIGLTRKTPCEDFAQSAQAVVVQSVVNNGGVVAVTCS